MTFENSFRDGESETRTAGSAGEEGVEHARRQVGWDPGARVSDVDRRKGGGAANFVAYYNREFTAAGVRHRFGRIEDEVQQHLLNLPFVSIDDECARRSLEARLHLGLR